jgi:aminoglycoside phosphotransferase (APT) family kinase protein
MGTELSVGQQSLLDGALEAVCRRVGFDPAGAELIKYTMNAVYRLDDAGVVVRIAVGDSAAARVDRAVQVAAMFTNLGVPTVPLAPGYEAAIHVEGWSASVWMLLSQPTDRTWAPVDLAGPLRAIHAINESHVVLPSWDPVAKSRRRLQAVDALGESDRQYMHRWSAQVGVPLDDVIHRLHRWCDDLDEAVGQVDWHLPPGVIHGDAHTGNLLAAPDGRTVLCDLDSVAIGPREWDLVPAAHGPARFGRDCAEYTLFAKEYGFDMTIWPGWKVLRQIRELQLVTSVIASVAGRPAVADELAHRLRSIFTGNVAATWRRYR